jgi:hypothetical protein
MIPDEPRREELEEDEFFPITRGGANVYKTSAEAEEVIQHLGLALAAVIDWAAGFKSSTISPDVRPQISLKRG